MVERNKHKKSEGKMRVDEGLSLLQANFYVPSWNNKSDVELDALVDRLNIQLKKIAQHLELDVRDEDGELI